MNLAAIWNLPAIFLLENNHYAVSTPIEQSSRNPDLFRRGHGYDVTSSVVNGNDVLKIFEKTTQAAEICRNGKGPVLIEAKTYRHGGHHVNDPGEYMPTQQLEHFKQIDPIKVIRKYLKKLVHIADDEIKEIEDGVKYQMEIAIESAKKSDEPSAEEFLEMVQGY